MTVYFQPGPDKLLQASETLGSGLFLRNVAQVLKSNIQQFNPTEAFLTSAGLDCVSLTGPPSNSLSLSQYLLGHLIIIISSPQFLRTFGRSSGLRFDAREYFLPGVLKNHLDYSPLQTTRNLLHLNPILYCPT